MEEFTNVILEYYLFTDHKRNKIYFSFISEFAKTFHLRMRNLVMWQSDI